MFAIETVAVLGASEGGTTCAVLAALAGCAVRLHGRAASPLERARDFAARVNGAARIPSAGGTR